MFDRVLWKQDIIAIETEILSLKGLRRESHQPRWNGNHAYRLLALKEQATRLYFLRARSRGRMHTLFGWEPERLAAFEKLMAGLPPRYVLPDPMPVELQPGL